MRVESHRGPRSDPRPFVSRQLKEVWNKFSTSSSITCIHVIEAKPCCLLKCFQSTHKNHPISTVGLWPDGLSVSTAEKKPSKFGWLACWLRVYCTTMGTYHSSAQKEAVLVHVEFSGGLEDFGTHLEGEEQFVPLEQTTTREPGYERRGVNTDACLRKHEAILFQKHHGRELSQSHTLIAFFRNVHQVHDCSGSH